jgi:phage N-6-adenine-methyltransferase
MSDSNVVPFAESNVPVVATVADAEQALKTIAVAEAAETLWERAKNPEELYKAITTKLKNQAAYVVWRQDVAVHGFGPGRGNKEISDQQSLLPPADPGPVVVHRWRKRLCLRDEKTRRWIIDQAKMDKARDDAGQRCVRLCEQENMGVLRGTLGTGEIECYTPAEWIEHARTVMGGIDLDPATCEQAQQVVQAAQYYTAEHNGLGLEWHGRVWLNPPYRRDLMPLFVAKLLEELAAGRTAEAIMLTNNTTETVWFQHAANLANVLCFTAGRIDFYTPDDTRKNGPTQGQAFFYFGPNSKNFVRVFKPLGVCVRPV